jgi:hypothetical protein
MAYVQSPWSTNLNLSQACTCVRSVTRSVVGLRTGRETSSSNRGDVVDPVGGLEGIRTVTLLYEFEFLPVVVKGNWPSRVIGEAPDCASYEYAFAGGYTPSSPVREHGSGEHRSAEGMYMYRVLVSRSQIATLPYPEILPTFGRHSISMDGVHSFAAAAHRRKVVVIDGPNGISPAVLVRVQPESLPGSDLRRIGMDDVGGPAAPANTVR